MTTSIDDARRYLELVGLEPAADFPDADVIAARFADAIATARAPEPAAVLELYRYQVPRLSPDGSCSMGHDLEPEPHDLRGPLATLDEAALAAHPESLRLARLQALVGALHETIRSDWSGIYRRVEAKPAYLEKQAYRGRPSRARFPLTEEFAARSNNSTAALGRWAILVADVDAHVAQGGAYYECDAEVRSELCLPVVDAERLLGLIDVESFRAKHFDPHACLAVAMVADLLVREKLLEPSVG